MSSAKRFHQRQADEDKSLTVASEGFSEQLKCTFNNNNVLGVITSKT